MTLPPSLRLREGETLELVGVVRDPADGVVE
jgi:hypothetical protein